MMTKGLTGTKQFNIMRGTPVFVAIVEMRSKRAYDDLPDGDLCN